MHRAAPKNRTVRMLVWMLSIVLLASQASALSFSFVMADDPADWPWIARDHTPGVVTGVIHGLQDNLANQIPTSIDITSDLSALGMTGVATTTTLVLGGLTVSGGVLTAANLLWNFDDPSVGRMQLRFNYESRNVVHWNGGTGPRLGMGNANGFTGAVFSLVPEPQVAGLVAMGLVGCFACVRREIPPLGGPRGDLE